MLNWSVRILGNILCVFIASMESVKQKCRAIYLLPIAGIISTAEKENERQKQCSFYDLITWSTFGKHENSSLLKNSVNITWKSILKLGNLRIFSLILNPKVAIATAAERSICMRKTTFATQSSLHGFP